MNAPYLEVDGENVGLAEPSAGALPVNTRADQKVERCRCGMRT